MGNSETSTNSEHITQQNKNKEKTDIYKYIIKPSNLQIVKLPNCQTLNICPNYRPSCLHIYISTYLHIYIPTYLHTYITSCLHTYLPIYLHTTTEQKNTNMGNGETAPLPQLHAYISTYLHTYIPAYLNTFIPSYLHTCIPKYLHPFIPT